MSPRWAEVGAYALYFYFSEPHERPHVAVRHGKQRLANVDLMTGELLAGHLEPKVLRAVQQFLAAHRAEAIAAFKQTLGHQFPGRIDTTTGEEDGR